MTFLLLSLAVSSGLSPDPLFALGNVLLLGVVALGSFNLSAQILLDPGTLGRLKLRLLQATVGLLIATLVVAVVAPQYVSPASAVGGRILGGAFADPALLALVLFFLSLDAHFVSRRLSPIGVLLALGLSLLTLGLSNARWAYVAFIVGVPVFFARFTFGNSRARRNGFFGVVLMLVVLVIGVSLADQVTQRPGLVSEAIVAAIRNPQSLTTLSGRTSLFGVFWNQTLLHPFGQGYAIGPRLAVASEPQRLARDGIVPSHIGNAHNMWFEVGLGGGWVAVLSLALLLVLAVRGLRKLSSDASALFAVLLIVLLLEGLVSSNVFLPFNQGLALLFIVLGVGRAARVQ